MEPNGLAWPGRKFGRRRATEALHSHLIEEPAQASDLCPARLAPGLYGVVVLLARDPAGQHVVRRDRLRLDPQVLDRRAGCAQRPAAGDSGA